MQGGVVGGVIGYGTLSGSGTGIGGGIGIGIGIGSIGTGRHPVSARCAPLVDHLIDRVFKDETRRAFANRMCRIASTRALDCLEQALSGDSISAAEIVTQCGDDLPPALTRRLRSL